MRVIHSDRPGGISFHYFYNIKLCCVFALESPQRGDSSVYTNHTRFNIKKKFTNSEVLLYIANCVVMGLLATFSKKLRLGDINDVLPLIGKFQDTHTDSF